MNSATIPTVGFIRITTILSAIQIGKSTLWKMVADRRFPQPCRPSPFGPAVTVWRAEDIHAFIRGEWKPDTPPADTTRESATRRA